ncbi:hypothetical protein GDO81_017511 [Engystomops pustulosus]|uniref:Uncharacterized protein n=1 Tax=Engystomops pustulosus TaxID=76066 RepID=A0AAV7ALE9_ENGPU|nr:hypothetical protein GDO81_017511 [Engystomops pustulosus]
MPTGDSPPPSYKDLSPYGHQYDIYCIYNEAFRLDYLPGYNQEIGGDIPTSLSGPPITSPDLLRPPDYCELPPPYSSEDPPPPVPPGCPPGSSPSTTEPSHKHNVVSSKPVTYFCLLIYVINIIMCPPIGLVFLLCYNKCFVEGRCSFYIVNTIITLISIALWLIILLPPLLIRSQTVGSSANSSIGFNVTCC